MVESSKILPMFLLFAFMAAVMIGTVIYLWGGFDVLDALSLRSFPGIGDASSPTVSPAGGSPAPQEAEPLLSVDRYPVVSLEPNPRPLFAP